MSEKVPAIPTEADWRSEPWGLDEPYSYEQFFGKSLEGAFELIAENSCSRQEDVAFMPFRCFCFYIWAYINYLRSECSRNDADGGSCFIGLARQRSEDIKTAGEDTVRAVVQVLNRIASHQAWFDADVDIYGDFHQRTAEVLQLFRPSNANA